MRVEECSLLKRSISLLCSNEVCWERKGWFDEYIERSRLVWSFFPIHLGVEKENIFTYWNSVYWKDSFYIDSKCITHNHEYMDFCHPLITIANGSWRKLREWRVRIVFHSSLLCSYRSIPFSASSSPSNIQILQRDEGALSF